MACSCMLRYHIHLLMQITAPSRYSRYRALRPSEIRVSDGFFHLVILPTADLPVAIGELLRPDFCHVFEPHCSYLQQWYVSFVYVN